MWLVTNPLLKMRATEEIDRRLHSSETFTQPLRKPSDEATRHQMKDFLTKFYKEVYTPDKKAYYKNLLEVNSDTIKLHYDILVPKIVPYEDFWQRYEYRCSNIERVMEELSSQGGSGATQLLQKRASELSGSIGNLAHSLNSSIRNISLVGVSNSSHGHDDSPALTSTNHDGDDDTEEEEDDVKREETQDQDNAVDVALENLSISERDDSGLSKETKGDQDGNDGGGADEGTVGTDDEESSSDDQEEE